MPLKLFTMGVYGFDEEQFFKVLVDAGIDTFCDIRARRGMRGSQYSFVNSQYLQSEIRKLGINYYHIKDLAPSENVRAIQRFQDKNSTVTKRGRLILSLEFIKAYQKEVKEELEASKFLAQFDPQPKALVLFCVERQPEACHRSIVATKLAEQLHISVKDILP